MRSVGAVFVRALVLIVGPQLLVWGLSLLSPEDVGANIGAGLLAFLLTMVVSLVWALIDGRSSATFLRTALIWLVVALIVAVASAFLAQSRAPGIDLEVLLSDLAGLSMFTLGLILLPALIGAGVGTLLARRATPPRLKGRSSPPVLSWAAVSGTRLRVGIGWAGEEPSSST